MPRRSILPFLSAVLLVEHHSAFQKKLILPYTTTDTHMNLEDMTLSEISQLQKDKYCMIHSSEEGKIVKVIGWKRRIVTARKEGEMGSY